MTVDPAELAETARGLGITWRPDVEYQLEDAGPSIYSNGHRPHCPFACGDPHLGDRGQPDQGSSCPYRRVSVAEAYGGDLGLVRLKRGVP